MKSRLLPSTRIAFLLVFSFFALGAAAGQSQKSIIDFPRLEVDPQAAILRSAYEKSLDDSKWRRILDIGL